MTDGKRHSYRGWLIVTLYLDQPSGSIKPHTWFAIARSEEEFRDFVCPRYPTPQAARSAIDEAIRRETGTTPPDKTYSNPRKRDYIDY